MKHLARHKNSWLLMILVMLISGCTGLRKIGEGEHLYTGSTIVLEVEEKIKNRGSVEDELYGLIDLQPNTKLLWMRPFLSLHNMIKEPKKEKGVRYWLKYKVGESPAMLSELKPENIDPAIVNRLQNRGFFDASSSHIIELKQKTATAIFTAHPGFPYHLRTINYPVGNTLIEQEIQKMRQESLLKSGAQYNLSDFRDERTRIDEILKENGYFYFSPDNLIFRVDSAVGNREIDVELQLKPNLPAETVTPYRIGNVFVSDDFTLTNYQPDTTQIGGFYYISSKNLFKPKVILNAVFLEKDSLYSRTNHFFTLRHLMGLGVYKFTNAHFSKVDTTQGLMNVGLFLTPMNKISFSSEVNLAVATNYFAGPGLNLVLKNRNLLKGAELLTITLGGRFEWQVGQNSTKGNTNYELTLDGSLTFPRIVPGNFSKKSTRQFVPKTIVSVGGGFFARSELYQLNSFSTSLGYAWKPNIKIDFLFRPIDISFTKLAESSAEFEDYLNQNPNIRRSFEEQFILGTSFTFNLSNLHNRNRKTNFYLSESIDLGGNLPSLVFWAVEGEKSTPENPNTLLSVAYSQFARFRQEFRYFYKTGKKSMIAWRAITHAAIPYWNSSTVPYVKQFYVGGTNSVRAFRSRTVGPGTYAPPQDQSNLYVDQTGDIKLETSLEYRFPIYGYFKGAIFADAGNIWLMNEDEQRPGGKFNFDTFYKELAVGAGLGLRIDVDFFVIRFDLAFPLRSPSLPEDDRWLFNDVNFGEKSWRRDNLLLNIAIGYPF